MITRQKGFTFIEVVVAFAIFALSVGALYEIFAGAVHRTSQAAEREEELLAAQSLLARLRLSPTPWGPAQSGQLDGGRQWRIEVKPSPDVRASPGSSWQALEVTVHVTSEQSPGREAVLRSIELARVAP